MISTQELIIRIDGGVQETNFPDYAKVWTRYLENINLAPETDQEFADTQEFVKACTSAEKEIKSILDAAINGTAEVSELFRGVNGLLDKMRTVRLSATKAVKAKKEEIKAKIIQDGEQRVKSFVSDLYGTYKDINGCLTIDLTPVAAATKGLKTTQTMSDAADKTVNAICDQIGEIADQCNENLKLINASEFSGLFPDKLDLIKKPQGEVVAEIKSREAEHRLETERREQALKVRNPEALGRMKSEIDEKGHFLHLERWAAKHAGRIKEELPNQEDLEEFRAYYSTSMSRLKGDPPAPVSERPQEVPVVSEQPKSDPPAPVSERPQEVPVSRQTGEKGQVKTPEAVNIEEFTLQLEINIKGTNAQASELTKAFHKLICDRGFIVGEVVARKIKRECCSNGEELKSFISRINESQIRQDHFDISEIEFPDEYKSVLTDIDIVSSEKNVDKHRWYETSESVLKTPIGYIGVRHISGIYSEMDGVEDIGLFLDFFEVKQVTVTEFIRA